MSLRITTLSIECCYVECCDYLNVMVNAVANCKFIKEQIFLRANRMENEWHLNIYIQINE